MVCVCVFVGDGGVCVVCVMVVGWEVVGFGGEFIVIGFSPCLQWS